MDYTLDLLGQRLVELASDDASRDEIEASFARFSEQVSRDEVSPVMIETVAANVLNLRARGAQITPEDAELMLFQSTPASTSDPSDRPSALPAPAQPMTQADFGDLNERLETLFKVADAVHLAPDSTHSHYMFAVGEEGIHVAMSPDVDLYMAVEGFGPIKQDLERREWVIYEQELAQENRRDAERFYRQSMRLAEVERMTEAMARESEARAEGIAIRQMKRANRLASMGVTVAYDTTQFNLEIDAMMKDIMAEVEGLEGLTNIQVMVAGDSTVTTTATASENN